MKYKLVDARRQYNEIKGMETGDVVSRGLYDMASADIVELQKEVAQS